MKIIQYTPGGIVEKTLTAQEILSYARDGNMEALKELIKARGGWSALTTQQKDKIILKILGDDNDLS